MESNKNLFKIDPSKVHINYEFNERHAKYGSDLRFYDYGFHELCAVVINSIDKKMKMKLQIHGYVCCSDKPIYSMHIDKHNTTNNFIVRNIKKIIGDPNILFRHHYTSSMLIYMIFPYKFKCKRYARNTLQFVRNVIVDAHSRKRTAKLFGFDIFPLFPTSLVEIILDYSDLDWTLFKHLYMEYSPHDKITIYKNNTIDEYISDVFGKDIGNIINKYLEIDHKAHLTDDIVGVNTYGCLGFISQKTGKEMCDLNTNRYIELCGYDHPDEVRDSDEMVVFTIFGEHDLDDMTFPPSVKYLGIILTLYRSSTLNKINIPKGIEKLWIQFGFMHKSYYNSIIIPDSVEYLYISYFCEKHTSNIEYFISIPKTVKLLVTNMIHINDLDKSFVKVSELNSTYNTIL